MDTNVRIGSVKTVFEIIEKLSYEDGLSVSELAQAMDIPFSTAYDYIQSLEQLQYVTKEDQIYHPSYRFLQIGATRRGNNNTYEIAQSEIEAVAEETGELVTLMVEEHGRGVHLTQVSGKEAVEFKTYPGARLHLHTLGQGKAILAHLPKGRVDEIVDFYGLPSVTEHTITDREKLLEELKQIREQGTAVDRSECIDGIACIGAPILNNDNYPQASVGVCTTVTRLDAADYEKELRNAVSRVAERLQVQLNYT